MSILLDLLLAEIDSADREIAQIVEEEEALALRKGRAVYRAEEAGAALDRHLATGAKS